jgi:hypothetical protein
VLKLVSIISFRYSVISGLNTNPLELAYHQAARAVLEGRRRTPADVFETLRSIYVEDESFQRSMALVTFGPGGSGKKLAKYVLARLESDASARACDPDTDPATIEHVLPENPSAAWEATFPERLWEASIYRLGNLTLLEPFLNRRVANLDYPQKVAAYAESRYVLTVDLTQTAPDEWTPERLDARQRRLAVRAVHLWRADFA